MAELPPDFKATLPELIREWVAAEKAHQPALDAEAMFKNATDGLSTMVGETPSKEGMIKTAARTWAVVEGLLPTDDDLAVMDAIRAHMRAFSLETGELLSDTHERLDALNARIDVGDFNSTVSTPVAELRRRHAELSKADRTVHEARLRLEMLRDTILFGNMLASVDGQILCIALTRWADAAFPQVEVGHKYAAALLVSTTTADVLERVRLPWPAFVIEVPDGLLSIDDADGALRPVRRVVVSTLQHNSGERRWSYVAMTDSPLSLWRHGCTTADLMKPSTSAETPVEDALPFTDKDDRTTILLGRLVIATCLAMSDPANVQEVGIGHAEHAKAQKRKRRFGRPIVRTFKVGKPIKLDFRQRVAEYARGTLGGKKLTVQTLVCGHFKGQHYGPKNTLYKIIWREPFWRGPEEAPILVRPHVGRDDK